MIALPFQKGFRRSSPTGKGDPTEVESILSLFMGEKDKLGLSRSSPEGPIPVLFNIVAAGIVFLI